MKYNKKQHKYLGKTNDSTDKEVDGFLIEGNVHIVYDLDKPDQFNTSRPLKELINNEDKFMWTPYAIFGSKAKNLSKY